MRALSLLILLVAEWGTAFHLRVIKHPEPSSTHQVLPLNRANARPEGIGRLFSQPTCYPALVIDYCRNRNRCTDSGDLLDPRLLGKGGRETIYTWESSELVRVPVRELCRDNHANNTALQQGSQCKFRNQISAIRMFYVHNVYNYKA